MKKDKNKPVKRIGTGGIFLRRLPVTLGVIALLCVLVVSLYDLYLRSSCQSSQEIIHNSLLVNLDKISEKYNGKNYENRLAGHLCIMYNRTEHYGEVMDESMVVQVENKDGEQLIPVEETYVLKIMHEGTEPEEYFYCDASEFEKAVNEVTELYEAYLDRENRKFLPAGSSSDTGSMTYTERGKEIWLLCKTGTDADSEVYQRVMNHYSSDKYTFIEDKYFVGTRYMDYIVSPEGEVYTVKFAQLTDYSRLLYSLSVKGCVIVFVISMLVLLFASWRTAVVYKSHYAMEDYRREITNTMAHDLKSPLMAISGCAEMLSNGCEYEKSRHYADVILANVNYMNGIISNVLELAKLEGGRKPEPEDIDLRQLEDSLLEKYTEKLSSQRIKYAVTGSGIVSADRMMLSQALDNLLSNAVKYTPDGGSIDISISGDSFTIENDSSEQSSVSDEELWKPFVKGDSARSSEKGSGIGLSIVRSVCDAHGFTTSLARNGGRFAVTIKFVR